MGPSVANGSWTRQWEDVARGVFRGRRSQVVGHAAFDLGPCEIRVHPSADQQCLVRSAIGVQGKVAIDPVVDPPGGNNLLELFRGSPTERCR